jgi:phage terminase small subunit
MTDDKPLTEQQFEFCRAYVSCQNASMAARKVGYSERSAANQGSRLLRDPRIRAEINRLKQAATNTVLKLMRSSQADADDPAADQARKGLAALPIEIQNAVYAEVREKLDREWVIDRLMHNVRIAMGEVKTTQTRVVQYRPARAGEAPVVTEVHVEVFQRDAAAANQGLAVLLREVDRMEEEARQKQSEAADDDKQPAVKRNPALAKSMRRFMEHARPVTSHNADAAISSAGNGTRRR